MNQMNLGGPPQNNGFDQQPPHNDVFGSGPPAVGNVGDRFGGPNQNAFPGEQPSSMPSFDPP